MKKLSLVTLTIIILITAMGLSLTIGGETQITSDSAMQGFPAISGNNIIWLEDSPNGPNDPPGIYLYDISTGIKTLIASTPPAVLMPFVTGRGPAISGDRIVWGDTRNGSGDIYLYDIATGIETQLTTDLSHQADPAISGDRIVWVDGRNGKQDIYLYDISTGIETKIKDSTGAETPTISGDRIVWHEHGDIYLYDIATGIETQITTEIHNRPVPKISGNNIVWMDDRNGSDAPTIYHYDIATGKETQITTEPHFGWSPTVSSDNIVWVDASPTGFDIYLHDIAAGKTIPITNSHMVVLLPPAISEDKIVWVDVRNGYFDIYLYEIGSTPPITTISTTSVITTTTTTSVTTTTTTICPTEEIYGTDSEEVEVLRYIRDNVLNRSSKAARPGRRSAGRG